MITGVGISLLYCSVFQTVVTAVDNRTPARTGSATIIINVNYDDYLPVISGGNRVIEAFVSENANIGTSVARVSATDQDIIEDNEVSEKARYTCRYDINDSRFRFHVFSLNSYFHF